MKSENADQETEQAYFQQRIANREAEVESREHRAKKHFEMMN